MKRNKGFSLVELMVVISIIAILMALGAVSYTTAQRKARDSKRRGDMNALQQGFEQYYTTNGRYGNSCAAMAIAPFLQSGMPGDPKPSWTAYNCTSSSDTYCACARLENETGNASANNCSNFTAGSYFCVSNQQ